jgi:hypothetical protein
VAPPRSAIRRILELSGFDRHRPIAPTVAAGIESLRSTEDSSSQFERGT